MSMECPYCLGQADHCHGALVRHADSTVECTDSTCVHFGADRHDLAVVCEIGPDVCSCTLVSTPEAAEHQ